MNSNPNVDVHLTKKGIEQARRLSEKLKAVDFEAIYVTELPRTTETAKVIFGEKTKLIVEPRFNDIKTGFEGRPAWMYDLLRYLTFFNRQISFGDGESLYQTERRIMEAVKALSVKHQGNIMVVSHLHTLRVFYKNLDLIEGKRRDFANASLSVFKVRRDIISGK